jgi:hypothetical protein
MSTNLQLVTECDPSPTRAQIAAAIEAVKHAATAAEAGHAAIARAEALVSKASDRLAAAKENTAKAREDRTARLISAASTGDDLPADDSARLARLTEEDAADELEAANNALAAMRDQCGDHDYEARQAERRLRDAIEALLAGELERLRKEAEQAARLLADKLGVLRFVTGQMIQSFNYRTEIHQLDNFRDNFRMPPEFSDSPTTAAWRDAIEALKTSPDAALPVAG